MDYEPKASPKHIKNPVLFYLSRLLTCSLFPASDGRHIINNLVLTILMDATNCGAPTIDLTTALALYFENRSVPNSQMMYCGGLITILAKHFGLIENSFGVVPGCNEIYAIPFG